MRLLSLFYIFMYTHEITLTAGIPTIVPAIRAVQFDTGRSLKMYIQDLTLVPGMTAQLGFTRPNGTRYGMAAIENLSTNSFVVDDISQALTQVGTVKCQLVVTQPNETVSTYIFKIVVEESMDQTVVEEEYWTIQNAIETAIASIDISNKVSRDELETTLSEIPYITNEEIDTIVGF